MTPRRCPSIPDIEPANTLTGTHEGDFTGLAATGRTIEVRGVQLAG